MSRWLFLVSCLGVLSALWLSEPRRAEGTQALGGTCEADLDCQVGLTCANLDGVLEGQCTAACNDNMACQDEFGLGAMCIGVDRCVRTCADDGGGCPSGTFCNPLGWCEGG